LATPAQKTLIPPIKRQGPFSSPEKQKLVLSLLLAAATVVLYNPVNHHPFINYDDDRYILQNTHIRHLSWETIRWAFTTTAEANWHPLTWLSHAVDCQLFHLNAAGHHLDSLLLHAVNAILLFLLVVGATRRVGRSWLVAALFAVHPLNVESVAWAAERKNLLCTFFFFLALWAYGWYVQKPNWRRYLAVAALFAMGLMSKPMVITLPFVLLLLDYWPLGRIQGTPPRALRGQQAVPQAPLTKLLLEKIPLLALSAASAWVTMYAQQRGGAVRSVGQFPLGIRLENSIVAYAAYLWKMVWPAHLAVLYPHAGDSLPGWQVGLGIAILLAISALALRYRSRRYLTTGWLWFLGTLVPVIGLVQVGYQSMADRYTYIPLIGVFVMLVWGVADLSDHWKLGLSWRLVAAAAMLFTLSWAARKQLSYWDSGLDLWSHTLAVNPNNFIAEDNLGDALLTAGKPDEAYSHFQRATAIMPRDPWSHANMGAYLQQKGRLPEAIAEYRITLSLSRDSMMVALTKANLASAYRDLGNDKDALESYNESIAINPYQSSAYFGRAVLYRSQGKLADAIRDFSQAVELRPTAEGYLRLGQALAEAHRRQEALAALDQALKISPESTEAQQAMAALKAAH
jgi:Tfp pilus assembly protein PilF